jgi:AcrR family transcriptional regulator
MTAAPPTVPGPVPTGRADARRNREIVLRTAARMFADDGLEVSLSRIAQRAGVGAGTVYRHFPSKEVLLEAVLAEQVDSLTAAADRWAARVAPGDALFGFLLEVIEKSVGRKGVCDALAADKGWPKATLAAASKRFNQALDRLLGRAQRAGAVRGDLRADDLSALMYAGAALCAGHRNRARGLQLVRLLLHGLHTTPAVTKPAAFRDTSSLLRHETADRGARYCRECGAPLRTRPTGRPPSYCGTACRQRARRRRMAD